jgi:glutathione peroxidase
VYDFEANLINGRRIALSEFEGKVLVIVNTASLCGYTKQYASLQKLYDKYKDRGFEILAFPSNDFGKQEPGNDEEIAKFCDLKFKVQFPLFSKVVVKNKGIHPLYRWLTHDEKFGGEIRWNFTKFIMNAKGELVARYESSVDPLDVVIIEQINVLIAEKTSKNG